MGLRSIIYPNNSTEDPIFQRDSPPCLFQGLTEICGHITWLNDLSFLLTYPQDFWRIPRSIRCWPGIEQRKWVEQGNRETEYDRDRNWHRENDGERQREWNRDRNRDRRFGKNGVKRTLFKSHNRKKLTHRTYDEFCFLQNSSYMSGVTLRQL